MSHEAAAEHPAPDREEILRVVRLYTDGVGARNPAMFREGFHPSARISWQTPDGQVHDALIADDIDRKPPNGWANWNMHVTGRILTVFQAGDVAVVALGFDADTGPEDCWLDIHSLLRIDGTWKIMNKTATHASRADWADLGATGAASIAQTVAES
jgi:hypothetical protein